MKKLVIILALALICAAGYAQRPGGSPSRGSSPSHSSMSASHGAPSHSSVSRSSSVSHSSVSRPSSSSRSSFSTPSRPSQPAGRSSVPSRSSVSRQTAPNSVSRGTVSTRPSQARETPSKGSSTPTWNGRPNTSRNEPTGHLNGQQPGRQPGTPGPGMNPGGQRPPVPHGMHPHPPMYHPMHHHPIHMHYCFIDHWLYEDLYWHGYYNYVHTYPYSEVAVYVTNNQNNTELIAVATDDNYVYSLYRDSYSREVYFTITDNTDRVVAKTQVHRKYSKLVTGDGGVWIFKNNDKDPLFFTYINGQLYKYEQD